MSLFNPTNDLATICDLVESITLKRFDTLEEIAIEHALQRPLSIGSVGRKQGEFAAEDSHFRIPVTELPDPPRMGDTIVDSTVREWSVREAQLVVDNSCWVCLCRRLD
jgi:hypothetical protein